MKILLLKKVGKMAFKRNDIKRLASIFDCEEKDVQCALHSTNFFLKKNGVNTYTVARAISVLSDQLNRSEKVIEVNFPTFGMRHKAIHHRAKIIDLYHEYYGTNKGWGSIAKEIKRLYKINVSRQTIKKYVQQWIDWHTHE